MTVTAHVYQIYIRATPAQVWTAITESEWTRRYFHSTSYLAPLVEGEPYRTVLPDGEPAIEGLVEQLRPPQAQEPGRLVLTWRVLYDEALAKEPPGRVDWTVEAAGDGLTRVRLVHGDLGSSPLTWSEVEDGWVWILDAMKTLIETGQPLPPARAVADDQVLERPGPSRRA